MTTPAWIGLGSNLGDRRSILDAALAALGDSPGVAVKAVSSYHETAPVGGPPGQGPFLNAAAHLETTLDPHGLLATLHEIENRAGRVRTVRWGERTLDLDILIYGCKFLETRELKLPHPRLAFRRFVLEPLAEIAPNVVETVSKRTIAQLLANLDRTPRLLVLNGEDGRRKTTIFRRLVDELPAFGISGQETGPIPEDARSADMIAPLDRKMEALKSCRWEVETLRVPWVVADYYIDYDFKWACGKAAEWTDNMEPTPDYRDGMRKIWEKEKDILAPTLVVKLTGDRMVRRTLGCGYPQLWPESDDPDVIVAEIIATCRSIEAPLVTNS